MPPEPKRAKSESLSLRLDPKTKFILEFVARINGQSITTVVERAIKRASQDIGTSPKWDKNGNELECKNWMTYWDPSDGVRTLRLISDPDYPTSYDEDELREFTATHWQFFYTNAQLTVPRRAYVDILWPRINDYLTIWRDEKSTDYWAAGKTMARDLSAARITPPEWPPQRKSETNKVSGKTPINDLDDDIPF